LISPDGSADERSRHERSRKRPILLPGLYWPVFRRGDAAGIVLVAIVLILAAFALVAGPKLNQKTNYGFGPDWDCVNPGKGGVTCIRQPANGGASK
jgi:hypothetical protein